MPRTLWFAAGAGAGVYVMLRARRIAEAFTVDGLRDRAGAAVVGLRAFREEVVLGQAEKETELRQRLRLVPAGARELTGSGRHEARETTPPTESGPTTESRSTPDPESSAESRPVGRHRREGAG